MKRAIALAFVVVAMIAAMSVWFAYDRALGTASIATNDSIDSSDAEQGAGEEQVIQKVIPQGPTAPEIASKMWLNSPPLPTQDLRGHVVVVEFWTHG